MQPSAQYRLYNCRHDSCANKHLGLLYAHTDSKQHVDFQPQIVWMACSILFLFIRPDQCFWNADTVELLVHCCCSGDSGHVLNKSTSDIHTPRHGVSLSAWYRPWILLGGLQARVRDLFSPATAFGLQYRRCGSCHLPVFTWRPSFPGHRSSSVERATAQCHLRTIFVLIPATPEDISFPATTASITLITVSWS